MGGVSIVCFDTMMILAPVLDEKGTGDIRRTLFRVSGDSFRGIIPQPVMGEVMVKILEIPDDGERIRCFERLLKFISDQRIDVGRCLPHVPEEAYRIFVELGQVDEQLSANDRIILAYALANRESKFFLTNDSSLIDNERLVEYERRLRNEDRRDTVMKIRDSV